MKHDKFLDILSLYLSESEKTFRLSAQIKRLKQSHRKAQESFVDDLRKIIKEKAEVIVENEQLRERIYHLEILLRQASGVIYSYEHARVQIENALLTGKHVREWINSALPNNESESISG